MKHLIVSISLVLLTACQSVLIHTNSRYIEASRDATIEITEPLEVPPNSARAYLQNGELKPQGKLDLYRVNCEVEINTVSETRQTIPPGIFKIISIRLEESPIVMSKPLMFASLSYSTSYAWFDDSPVDIKRYYYFQLSPQETDSTSDVRAVICRGAQSEPYNAELPTLEQMQAASGDYLRFSL